MGLPTSKIEDRAIGVLQNIINKHPTMSYEFKRQDKEMCWDGNILIFDSQQTQSKKTFSAKIPVQIKGHINNELACTKKMRITYPVSIDDLNVYFKDRGVLYFQIFISDSGKEKEIFYSSLFGSKLKTYKEKAEGKGNTTSINIAFTKLSNDVSELYSIANHFSLETKTQGFGEGQIVPRTVPFDDLTETADITLLTEGILSENEFFQRLSAGDMSFYATFPDGIKVPIEWTDSYKTIRKEKINAPVCINRKAFYNHFELNTDFEGNQVLILSKNLSFDLNNGSLKFQLKTSFKQLRTDAEFLLASAKANAPIMAGSAAFHCTGILENDLVDILNLIIEIDDILKMIEFDFSPPEEGITGDILNQFSKLVSIKNGKYNEQLTHQNNLYTWKIDGKYMPIIIYKLKGEEKIGLSNALYTKSHQLFMTDADGKRYIVPLFYPLQNKVFANLYYYDYNYLKEQIDTEDIAEFTFEPLNDCAVLLISAYDSTHNPILLELAQLQLEKIEELAKDDIYFLINKMQVKVRAGTFDANDKATVQNIQTNDSATILCKNILLGNFNDAKASLNQLSEEEKTYVNDWPILHLLHQSCK